MRRVRKALGSMALGLSAIAICAASVWAMVHPGDDAKAGAGEVVSLRSLTYKELETTVLTNPKAKLILMDAWATWCATCKENFPHLVEMHKKYADRGLSVVSLSVDDPTDKKAAADALAFLKEKNATFTNVLLNEEEGVAFERLKMQAIPAVFLFSPDGKVVRSFTLDDVDNQFTYEDVEKAVVEILGSK